MGGTASATSLRTHIQPTSTTITGLPSFASERRDASAGGVCSPYLVLGLALALLFVGVGLTAASFHSYRESDNHLAVVAPLCLIAGLIVTSRLVYKKFKHMKWPNQCSSDSSNATPLPQINSEGNAPAPDTEAEQRQLEEDEQAIYLEPTSPDSLCPYSDDPPSYAQVAEGGIYRQRRAVEPLRFGAMVNPALEEDSQDSHGNQSSQGQGRADSAAQTDSRCHTPAQDSLPPPPPYEECKHITQTSL